MKKILVIEDNSDVRDNIVELLQLTGYEVIFAQDGIEGIEKAMAELPDLIICDIMMPRLDGFGTLRILSQKPQTNNIPFIFLTAKAEKSDFRTGMNLGADDYLVKPFDHNELLEVVETRLKKAERLDKTGDADLMYAKTLTDERKGQEELEKLARSKSHHYYRKKDLVFSEGEKPKRLYYINNGKVKTFRTNTYGKSFITGIHQARDFVGIQAVLKDRPYEESAAAIEDSEISFIPKEEFLELLNNNRDFMARFIKMLTSDIAEKEEQLISLAYNSIRKRVADALIKLNRQYQAAGDCKIDILREDLASIVGTTKESISRMLTDFKSENLIDVDSNGRITVLDEEHLALVPS